MSDASQPDPVPAYFDQLKRPEPGAPDELIKDRFLTRTNGVLVVAPTGLGKSTWLAQCAIAWEMGLEAFGLVPTRPLKSLVIQAENDDGDMAIMVLGVCDGLGIKPPHTPCFRICHKTGNAFFELLRRLVKQYRPDVIWIDPALSFLGGDQNSQKDVSHFLRNGLNAIILEASVGLILIHHTPKPTNELNGDWVSSDVYKGSGSAEWANWARGVIILKHTAMPGVFEMHAAKRGRNLGWRNADGDPTTLRRIAYAQATGERFWHDQGTVELIKKGGRKASHGLDDLRANWLPGTNSSDWLARCKANEKMSDRTFYRLLDEAKELHLVVRDPDHPSSWCYDANPNADILA